ncbi:MAG TPA: MXAN_5187 C-terminal domain-containing protein [Vicinamibacterales bacterium]|nr:MXAN_5187 C-terminal domain-containing protein [Vicinamibacterales bacterium]
MAAPPTSPLEKELRKLEADLKQLEAEYNMYFSGRLPKPPWETRARVEKQVTIMDRAYIQNTGDRFRFHTLQSRFSAFIDLWDRGLRAREEGRPGPFGQPQSKKEPEKKGPEDRIVHVASFRDPVHEVDKLADLYESLTEARREIGQDQIPFHKFAELVKTQVKKLRETGSPEVAFRVAVKGGKVNLTARALKGVKD